MNTNPLRPQTLAQKLIARAAGRSHVAVGEVVTCNVDLAMFHDSSGPRRLKPMLEELGAPIWDKSRVVLVMDHFVPEADEDARRIVRFEYDGAITVLADSYNGKPLNSPNDVVVKSDGSIWFTDPHYGIMTDYEGFKAPEELPCSVYRIAPDGTVEAVITDMACPNGLAFSPDESRLYVADTGRMFSEGPQHIRVFDMVEGRPRTGRPPRED